MTADESKVVEKENVSKSQNTNVGIAKKKPSSGLSKKNSNAASKKTLKFQNSTG